MNNELIFSNMEIVEGRSFTYPVIKVINNYTKCSGYIMPFRFSYFQVSGTPAGELDMGGGDAIRNKLTDIVEWESIHSINVAKYRLKIELVKALNNYVTNTYGSVGKRIAFTLDSIPWFTESLEEYYIPRRSERGEKVIDEFIDINSMIEDVDKFIDATFDLIVNYNKIEIKAS